jgi:zinc protease
VKKLIIYILPITLLLACARQQSQVSQMPAPAPAARSLEVVELPLPESDKIVVKLMFRNGSVSDPAGQEGLTYTTAQLMTAGGTLDLTKEQIAEQIYPMAARYGSSVDKEVSVFTFAVHRDFLDEFYPIMVGLVRTPTFLEEDFKRVISNQQNYVDQVIRASSDEDYSKKALEDLLFRGTNYQHMVQGTSAGVQRISLEDVKQHYRNFFTRHNLTLGLAGNYPPAFLERLKRDLAQLSDVQPALPSPGSANRPDGVQVEIIAKDKALGSAIFTGFPLATTRQKDDFAALMVANSYLGEHRKSYGTLYTKLRETRSMNYGDYSYIEWYDNGGGNMLPNPGVPRSSNYFSVWIRPVQIATGLQAQYPELKQVPIGHAHFALRLALREIDQLVQQGLTQDQFELTRDFLRSYSKLYVQTPEKQLGFLMDSRFYGRQDYIQELDALLAKLTVEDVNRAIRAHWQVENMFVTIVTDKSEAQPLAESLRNNSPSPMSYANLVREGLPQAVLAEDEEVAKYRLNIKSVEVIADQDTFKK